MITFCTSLLSVWSICKPGNMDNKLGFQLDWSWWCHMFLYLPVIFFPPFIYWDCISIGKKTQHLAYWVPTSFVSVSCWIGKDYIRALLAGSLSYLIWAGVDEQETRSGKGIATTQLRQNQGQTPLLRSSSWEKQSRAHQGFSWTQGQLWTLHKQSAAHSHEPRQPNTEKRRERCLLPCYG